MNQHDLQKSESETFGQYIARLRNIKKYSQRKLAQLCGISNTTINRIENDDTANPDLPTLKLLAKHLGIDQLYMLQVSGSVSVSVDIENKKEESWIAFKQKLYDAGIIDNGEEPSEDLINSIIATFETVYNAVKKRRST